MADVVLHQFPPMGGVLSLSPFCVKVQMALNLKGVPFQTADTMLAGRVSPTGKLPYLRIGSESFIDSSTIVREIDRRWPSAPRLIPDDRALAADAHLIEDWADEALYWFGVNAKFCVDEAWARFRPEFSRALGPVLGVLGPLVARRQTSAKLMEQGLGRRGPADIAAELDRHLDALDARLGGRSYLVGSTITVADLSVTSMLAQLCTGYTRAQGEAVARRPTLRAYVDRISAETKTAR
jgi:glutathione S-transferase